jgi:hypothetical protein
MFSLDIALVLNLEQTNGVHLPAQTLVLNLPQGMPEDSEREQGLQSMQAKIYTLPVRTYFISHKGELAANIHLDKYDDAAQQFTQTLAVDGKVVSSRSDKIGKGGRFNTAVEGQGAFQGVIFSHSRFQETQ